VRQAVDVGLDFFGPFCIKTKGTKKDKTISHYYKYFPIFAIKHITIKKINPWT